MNRCVRSASLIPPITPFTLGIDESSKHATILHVPTKEQFTVHINSTLEVCDARRAIKNIAFRCSRRTPLIVPLLSSRSSFALASNLGTLYFCDDVFHLAACSPNRAIFMQNLRRISKRRNVANISKLLESIGVNGSDHAMIAGDLLQIIQPSREFLLRHLTWPSRSVLVFVRFLPNGKVDADVMFYNTHHLIEQINRQKIKQFSAVMPHILAKRVFEASRELYSPPPISVFVCLKFSTMNKYCGQNSLSQEAGTLTNIFANVFSNLNKSSYSRVEVLNARALARRENNSETNFFQKIGRSDSSVNICTQVFLERFKSINKLIKGQ